MAQHQADSNDPSSSAPFKNTEDDDDTFFPFSVLTINAIQRGLIPRKIAESLKPPLSYIMDYNFIRASGDTVMNASFPKRVLRTKEKFGEETNAQGFPFRPEFNKEMYQSLTTAELELECGWLDYLPAGMRRVPARDLLPPHSPSSSQKYPIWERLEFNQWSTEQDIRTHSKTDHQARAVISAVQEERLHHYGCVLSSRESMHLNESTRLYTRLMEKLQEANPTTWNDVKCCQRNQHSIAKMASTHGMRCKTNDINMLASISNINVLDKDLDGHELKHFFAIIPDSNKHKDYLFDHIYRCRDIDFITQEDILAMVMDFCEFGFTQPYGDVQRVLQLQRARKFIESEQHPTTLRLSPRFNEKISKMEKYHETPLGPPLPNPSQIHRFAAYGLDRINRREWPSSLLNPVERDGDYQRASFEPGWT